MTNSVPSTNRFVVVTHVFPPQGVQSVTSPESRVVSTLPPLLGKCLKGEPIALGTVQIMIGVIVFLFGIVMAFYASTQYGVMFWGAMIYITAGSLTVRANKQLNPCLVKASLGMNIFSTISAGIAIIMHSLDLELPYPYFYYSCYGEYYSCDTEAALMSRSNGIAGVMLVLSILEFIVSICVSAFACKATCSSGTDQVIYISSQVPSSVSSMHVSAPPLNPSEMLPLHSSADGLKAGNPDDLPPEYTATQE